MAEPGSAIVMEPAMIEVGERPVLVLRHALPPHDVVERVSFQTTDHMRAVARAMLAEADEIDLIHHEALQLSKDALQDHEILEDWAGDLVPMAQDESGSMVPDIDGDWVSLEAVEKSILNKMRSSRTTG